MKDYAETCHNRHARLMSGADRTSYLSSDDLYNEENMEYTPCECLCAFVCTECTGTGRVQMCVCAGVCLLMCQCMSA